jgi:hypothetical protein
MKKNLIMMTLFLCASHVFGNELILSPELLKANFDALQGKLGQESHMTTSESEIKVKSDYGTYIFDGIEYETENLSVVLRQSTGGTVLIKVKKVKNVAQDAPLMQKDDALIKATSLLDSLGYSVDKNHKLIYGAFDGKTSAWAFTWQRTFLGYAFQDELISVTFSDNGGELCAFQNFISERKPDINVLISEKDARANALAHMKEILLELAGKEYSVKNIITKEKLIVYPNAAYLRKENDKIEQSQDHMRPNPRLVYVFELHTQYDGDADIRISVPVITLWIDAETGKVLGGL